MLENFKNNFRRIFWEYWGILVTITKECYENYRQILWEYRKMLRKFNINFRKNCGSSLKNFKKLTIFVRLKIFGKFRKIKEGFFLKMMLDTLELLKRKNCQN